jgi:sulfite reductase (NADPH) flavoprotein alpha-component
MSKQTTSLLPADQLELFLKLVNSFNREQLAWVSGYLAAFTTLNRTEEGILSATTAPAQSDQCKLTILYGSRTGNGAELAKKAQKLALDYRINATLKNMEDYKPRDLQSEKNLLVIVSTHGNGEPPFAAKELHQYIFGSRRPGLENVNYSVLALGDSSYFPFCQTGKDFDLQMKNLGANRMTEMALCDVDFKATAESWLKISLPAFAGISDTNVIPVTDASKSDTDSLFYSKQNPFQAAVLEKINLHGRGSDRQTLHIELSADLPYEPGDSAGIMPINASELVNALLIVTNLSANDEVEIDGDKITLFDALKQKIELSKITQDVVKRCLEFSPDDRLALIAQSPEQLQDYLYGRDIVDLFTDFPVIISSRQLVKLLRPMQPRLYSISSSPKATPGELHLTVSVVEYARGGRNRRGTCSGYLDSLKADENTVPVFIEKNTNFRLPPNDETPIIMVGAGTGIAPFRAFIQHREENEKRGESWLIFGNRNFENEFLYQTEWHKFQKSGALTRMDVAFSRDTEKRVYVQHKMAENAAEIFRWLENKAHIYICGDMKTMALDVQDTLVSIVEKQGNRDKDSAIEYINRLQMEKRFQLDVY